MIPRVAPLLAVLSPLLLGGCQLLERVEERLLSIEYYHVRFVPPPGLSPAVRDQLEDSWRSQVRSIAGAVAASITDSRVYGDTSLWDPLLVQPSATAVTRCRARNADSKSLKILPGQGQLNNVRVIAVSGDLANVDIPDEGPCDVPNSRRLRTLTIQLGPIPEGEPQFNFGVYEVQVGAQSNRDNWTPTDLASLTATFEPGPETGAAQFSALLVLKEQNWEGSFEEAIIITRGSYFGEVNVN